MCYWRRRVGIDPPYGRRLIDLAECAMFTKSEHRLVEILPFDHSFCAREVWPWRNDGTGMF